MFVFFVRLEVEDWRVRHSARQGAVLLEPTASLYINFEPLSTLMAIPSLSLDHGKSDDANFKAHDIDREIYDDLWHHLWHHLGFLGQFWDGPSTPDDFALLWALTSARHRCTS